MTENFNLPRKSKGVWRGADHLVEYDVYSKQMDEWQGLYEGMTAKCEEKSPIEIFKSQEQLDECLREWQHRLYLDGWIIKAEIVDEIKPARADEDISDAIGYNQVALSVSQSYIQILSAESCERMSLALERMCQEQVLVHELLHNLYDLAEGESYEATYVEVMEHQKLDRMAKSLIMAKYNLDYDYFVKP